MSQKNYSFQMFEFSEALSPYGTIETHTPEKTSLCISDFREGTHFRTEANADSNHLQLYLENKELTIVEDESGSMTWNDNNGDRYSYLTRLLSKLESTYPGTIKTNLIGFGGTPCVSNLFTTVADDSSFQDSDQLTSSSGQDFTTFLSSIFGNSVYDFAGVRVVRRTDRFPTHSSDGVIVFNGIESAVQDTGLTEEQPYYYGIWTFNKDGHSSNGSFIQITPRDKIVPKGVNFASIDCRILPGIEADNDTSLIYNLQENSGYVLLDSSGSNRHGIVGDQTIEASFWAGDSASSSYDEDTGKIKKSNGVRFDGLFDIVETDCDTATSITTSHGLTVNVWIYRYASSKQEWVLGTTSSLPSNTVGWAIGLDTSGEVLLAFDQSIEFGFPTSTGVIVPLKTWTMLTLSIDLASDAQDRTVFINGNAVWAATGIGSESVQEKIYIGAKPTDDSNQWVGTDYFGSLAQISISKTNRDQAYVEQLYETESVIFNQTIGLSDLDPPDNKQREVILNWIIGDEFDYSGGNVKIVRKQNSLPNHDADGSVVGIIPADEGEFFFVDSFSFIHSSDYYYRLFTVNSLGNTCERSEARALSVHIPTSANSDLLIGLSSVSDYSVIEGDSKIMIQWTNPSDDRVVGTKVFFSTKSYPDISLSPSGELTVSSGILVCNTTDNYFIHRHAGFNCDGSHIKLENGRAHYYTIVCYNNLGQISSPINVVGFPDASSDTVFPSQDVDNLRATIVNSNTVSLQWNNPTIKSSRLDLYFGESAIIYASIRNLFGGGLDDLDDIKLHVCTTIEERGIKSDEIELGVNSGLGEYSSNLNPDKPCPSAQIGAASGGGGSHVGGDFSSPLDENCNTEQNELETVISYGKVESGLIKGVLSHTNDREILARRNRYIMNIAAQQIIYDLENPDTALFKYNTEPVTVTFTHPVKITAVNKNQKFISLSSREIGYTRSLDQVCCCQPTSDQQQKNNSFNGAYCKAVSPYVCRIELQYKGESLPDGTPVNIQLFAHDDKYSLTLKSTKTSIKEGAYASSAVTLDELDSLGNPTGRIISKSIVDVEVPCPTLPDWVDVYASAEVMGFFVDVVHEIRFVNSLFIQITGAKPEPDGIDVSEQFATVWQVDPDDPNGSIIPVNDGTYVKWELIPKENGKNRPFYSVEQMPLITGVYSSTISGVARNIFFGPIGNLEKHEINLTCQNEDGEQEPQGKCCLAEEYEIHASVIYEDETAEDVIRLGYDCDTKTSRKHRFLINAATDQPGSNPHWITWADGEHLLKFQISQNAAISEVMGRDCFNECSIETLGGQLTPLPLGHLVSITAPGEILWNVVFEDDPYEDPYASVLSLASYEHVGVGETAHIPISGPVTDFYLRLNKFVGDQSPRPSECESNANSGGMGASGDNADPCSWENICNGLSPCTPASGRKWDNVSVVRGTTTLIFNNKEITIEAGGDYETGIPPVYAGFKEPLDVRVVDARINGHRADNLICDNTSEHSFVVEALFAGLPVPDGTAIELSLGGLNPEAISFSTCSDGSQYCQQAYSGKIYTRQVNDYLLNPDGDTRSLAYFTINPLSRDTGFQATINVTCKYDKLGTVNRTVTQCIDLKNDINSDNPQEFLQPPGSENTTETEKPVQNSMIVYNTLTDDYTQAADSLVCRLGHFFIAADEQVYTFGGFATKTSQGQSGITDSCEIYTESQNEWTYTANMPTARSHGMTAKYGDYIYCIGGVYLDSNNVISVSDKIEVFDTLTETWIDSFSVMPAGVAFGNASVFNDYIYITCGVISMIDQKPGDLNSKIFRYSITDDLWDTITPSNELLYSRITPFVCYHDSGNNIYVYGGSIPKPNETIEIERTHCVNKSLNNLRSYLLASPYYQRLSLTEQQSYIQAKEKEIQDGVIVPAFIYPNNGFKIKPGTETLGTSGLEIDISDSLDDEWGTMPTPRDHGQCEIVDQVVYFIGGSNQNQSMTMNRVEAINLTDTEYSRKASLSVGRAHFRTATVNENIYISGGLTSGHVSGWVKINTFQTPDRIEAMGDESGGLLITLTDDGGEIIDQPVRLDIRGKVHLKEIDDILGDFVANAAAMRAINATGENQSDEEKILKAQNSIVDPNSDMFQRNAASKLNEQIFMFPVLYSNKDIILSSGIGGTMLLPRAEDPLDDLSKLGEFIKTVLKNTLTEQESFDLGDEELAALGQILDTVQIPPVVINSNSVRELYSIETIITVLDDILYGQTVSQYDIEMQSKIQNAIAQILSPPQENESETTDTEEEYESKCYVLQSVSSPIIPSSNNPNQSSSPNTPGGSGSLHNSGQCLFCQTILPTAPDSVDQLSSLETTFYNITDWVPQVKSYLTGGTSSIQDALDEINRIKYNTPFGSSQIYDALVAASAASSWDQESEIKKIIYTVSDNAESLSINSRNDAIEEINTIDGDKKVPVIYTVFSTSYPASIASMSTRAESSDVEQITKDTGGQSCSLVSSNHLDYVLNGTIQAAGGLGYGLYIRRIDLGLLSAITSITCDFNLFDNTQGYIRIRYSQDGFNFTDWSEKFSASAEINVADFFAKVIDVEITLSTGFSSDVEEVYDSTSTGNPQLRSITFETSSERDDFIFVNTEIISNNTQQVAMAFEGTVPESSLIELGAASSNSSNWNDFSSQSRPVVNEFGRMFMLERDKDNNSIVKPEPLVSDNQWLYTANYGAWDPEAEVHLYYTDTSTPLIPEQEMLSGFRLYPRDGQIYFDTRQPPTRVFSITINNSATLRVGLRLRNRLHNESISVEGLGYIYSTNDVRPPSLTQAAPMARNASISPESPVSSDTISAIYDYVDLNNDKESGSLISWFKNGIKLLELQNKTSWSNNDLLSSHKLTPDDKIYFTIAPSDGRNYGITVFSPTVIIAAQVPAVEDLRIVPYRDGIINDRYDTSSSFIVSYIFSTDDTGLAALEDGTVITWYVNGQVFKTSTFTEINPDPYVDPKSIQPEELSLGANAHIIGNQIQVEVTPKTSKITGEKAASSSVTVTNSIPKARDVKITPLQPTSHSSLSLSYTIDDRDIEIGIQTNQSEHKWYRSTDGASFAEVRELRNSFSVSSTYLQAGHRWYAEVVPYDGLDLNSSVKSNTVGVLS